MTQPHHHCCPACGQPLPQEQAPVAVTVDDLRRWCDEHGHSILPGDRVRLEVAAEMVEYAPSTLRNWAYQRDPRLPCVHVAGRRPTFRLVDIAAFRAREGRGPLP